MLSCVKVELSIELEEHTAGEIGVRRDDGVEVLDIINTDRFEGISYVPRLTLGLPIREQFEFSSRDTFAAISLGTDLESRIFVSFFLVSIESSVDFRSEAIS